eukprot:gene24708-30078_t
MVFHQHFGIAIASDNMVVIALQLDTCRNDSFIAMQQGLFANNTAGDESDGNHQEASGGGIWVGTSQVELVDMGFEMNVAEQHGGGLVSTCYSSDCLVTSQHVTISIIRSRISDCSSQAFGGAFLMTSNVHLSLVNSSVVGNSALYKGGGLYAQGEAASIWHNVQDISHHAVDDAFAYSSKYRRLHLMHILFGFLQVLGQSTSIYSSEDTIPAVFFQFLRLPTLLSIGLNRWIPASCLGASMGFEKNAVYHLGGSFNMLMAYAIFPVIVLLPIAYLACNKTIMCASDDMECFFSSIYKCDVPGACSRDDLGRSNEDGSMVVSAEKLCTPGHRSGTHC